ncbi:putative leucine-rich repeat containing protein [Corchorus olitorius]|uniref:Leucine-rich repeat containing protein n=1 Tax=Corchorus olitorius TaxID=93759 RepID=A0A1R3HCY4_9ROSI|nr:putative leucine-rich repeat containing protein [Corchorus olitorius]
MADALLSAVANTILDNINSLWLQECGINGGLKTELERLHSTLTTIQAVLMDAEEKQWKSEAIKNWLKKLKDTAYDLDDILDDFATNTQRGSQVSTLISLPKQLLFRSKIAHKLKDIREKLDAIAGERSKFHLREGM